MKFIILFCLLLFQAVFAFADGYNLLLIPAIKPKDEKHAIIAGLSMDKFGFAQVLNCILLEPNTLVVLGKNGKYEGQLSVIDVVTNKTVVTKKYEEGLMQGRVLGISTEQAPSVHGFIVLYDVNRSGQKYEETDTYAEVYVRKDGVQSFQFSEPVKIAEARVAQMLKNGEIIYYSPEGGPARKTIAKLFVRDVNRDGYDDIVLWKKQYQYGRKGNEKKNGFYLSEEEEQAMLFDPKTLFFNLPSKTEKTIFSKEDLWSFLQPSQYFMMP